MFAAAWAPTSWAPTSRHPHLSCAARGAPDAPHGMHSTGSATMGVECGTLVEPPPGSGSCNISVPSISSDDIAAPHRQTRRSGMRQRYAARDAARAREFERQLDEEFHVHLRPFIEDPGNVARKQMEGLPWRLSMPGRSSKLRWWSCPVCAKEYEWPKEIVSITPQGGAT